MLWRPYFCLLLNNSHSTFKHTPFISLFLVSLFHVLSSVFIACYQGVPRYRRILYRSLFTPACVKHKAGLNLQTTEPQNSVAWDITSCLQMLETLQFNLMARMYLNLCKWSMKNTFVCFPLACFLFNLKCQHAEELFLRFIVDPWEFHAILLWNCTNKKVFQVKGFLCY